MIWSENKRLSAWILKQQKYKDYFIEVISRYVNMMGALPMKYKYKSWLDLFLFIYNNRLHVKKYPGFHNMVIIKLNEFINVIPIYTDLCKMYLQAFKND